MRTNLYLSVSCELHLFLSWGACLIAEVNGVLLTHAEPLLVGTGEAARWSKQSPQVAQKNTTLSPLTVTFVEGKEEPKCNIRFDPLASASGAEFGGWGEGRRRPSKK